MQFHNRWLIVLACIGVIILPLSLSNPQLAVAQSGGSYELTWSSIDGGGSTGTLSGGSYALNGTIGQADAGEISGGTFTLGGGFWGGGVLTVPQFIQKLFLPLIVR